MHATQLLRKALVQCSTGKYVQRALVDGNTLYCDLGWVAGRLQATLLGKPTSTWAAKPLLRILAALAHAQ